MAGYKDPPKDKQFQKGNKFSKGRPKKLPELDVLLAEEISDDDWRKMIKVLKTNAIRCKSATDLRSGEMLFNRGYGMPKQKSEVENTGVMTINFIPDGNKHSDKKPT